MRQFALFMTACLAVSGAPAIAEEMNFHALTERIDRLHEQDRHERVISVAEEALGGRADAYPEVSTEAFEAELRWRLSRAYLSAADLGLYGGMEPSRAEELLTKGIDAAQRASRLRSPAAEARFWEAANRIRRARLEGMVAALLVAGDVRDAVRNVVKRDPEHPEAHYMLAQLYTQAPGFPVSFGDDAKAVSFGKKALALHRAERAETPYMSVYHDFSIVLAEALLDRDWSERKRRRRHGRIREAYARAESPFERSAHYEGSVELPPGSDREEAVMLLEGTIDRLLDQKDRGLRQQRALEDAREALEAAR
jgi:hypothetical protein